MTEPVGPPRLSCGPYCECQGRRPLLGCVATVLLILALGAVGIVAVAAWVGR